MATWTPDELRRFLEAIALHRLAAAYVFAASTGMRRGEVLGCAGVTSTSSVAPSPSARQW